MQSRTLIQGCHALFREERAKKGFEIRARVIILIRSRGRNHSTVLDYYIIIRDEVFKMRLALSVLIKFLHKEFLNFIKFY